MQEIPIQVEHETVRIGATPGAIGKKWGTFGRALTARDFSGARITILSEQGAAPFTRQWAEFHERGHVHVIEDVADEYDTDAEAVVENYDRFQAEVEAWVRGIETYYRATPERQHFEFILDCLNSYRRSQDTPDEVWWAMRDMLADYAADEDDQSWVASDYVPLEPDPNEEPPECGAFEGDPSDEGDEDEGDDEDGDGSDEEGGATESNPREQDEVEEHDIEMKENVLDADWLDERVLAELRLGVNRNTVAAMYRLDVNAMPALARAIASTKGA